MSYPVALATTSQRCKGGEDSFVVQLGDRTCSAAVRSRGATNAGRKVLGNKFALWLWRFLHSINLPPCHQCRHNLTILPSTT